MDIETNHNGRVNLLQTKGGTATFMQDKIPVNTNSNFKNMIKYSQSETPLSRAFFSKNNVIIIQNGIRAGVYRLSHKKYIIDQQSSDVLNVIMHSIFLQNSIHNTENLKDQINALNELVLEYCIPKIYAEVKGYNVYKEDISTLSEPMPPPMMSYNKQNTLELKPFF